MVKFIDTKHVRTFGNEQYSRRTPMMTARHARTLARQLRDTGGWKARVDTYEDGYAIWGKKIPEAQQIRIKKSGKIKVVTIINEELALKFIESEVKKGRGASVKQHGKGYKIRTHPMKRIPRPKIIVKKSKLSKAALKRKVYRDEIVLLAGVSGKAKVRSSVFSNKTYTVEVDGRVSAQAVFEPEKDKNGKWVMSGYYLIAGVSTDEFSNTWEVQTAAQGIRMLRAEVDSVLSYATYINERWKNYVEGVDMMDFEESAGLTFEDVISDYLTEEGWDR